MSCENIGQEIRQEPEIRLAVSHSRIAWVLAHPQMSDWLKQALRSAEGLDPIALQNDIEMLRHLIVPRSLAQLELMVSGLMVE